MDSDGENDGKTLLNWMIWGEKHPPFSEKNICFGKMYCISFTSDGFSTILAISQDALVLDRVEQQALQNWENSCPLAKV